MSGMKALIAVLSAALLCGCPKSKSPDIPGVYVNSSTRGISTSPAVDAFDFRKDGTANRDWKIPLEGTIMEIEAGGAWQVAEGKLVFEGEGQTITTDSQITASAGFSPRVKTNNIKMRYEFAIEDNGDLIAGEGLKVGERYVKER